MTVNFTREELREALDNALSPLSPSDVEGEWIDLDTAWKSVLCEQVGPPEPEAQHQIDAFRAAGEEVTEADEVAISLVLSEGPWWVPEETSDLWTGRA